MKGAFSMDIILVWNAAHKYNLASRKRAEPSH